MLWRTSKLHLKSTPAALRRNCMIEFESFKSATITSKGNSIVAVLARLTQRSCSCESSCIRIHGVSHAYTTLPYVRYVSVTLFQHLADSVGLPCACACKHLSCRFPKGISIHGTQQFSFSLLVTAQGATWPPISMSQVRSWIMADDNCDGMFVKVTRHEYGLISHARLG